jgi:glutamate N-acetyltransferase / amino-acid N-acetyltransferase
MSANLSPLAPKSFPILSPLAGVRLADHECGIRYKDRTDLLVAELAAGTNVAGVFTKSLTCSAPVLWCRDAAAKGQARLLVVNSGNANAFTGAAGTASVKRCADQAAQIFGCKPTEVFIASTGTIGVALPDHKITENLPAVKDKLHNDGWQKAAQAIMTTDTFAKGATAKAMIDGIEVTINGIAKGAGMIAPDMATMLSFVFTDATLPHDVLQKLLTRGVKNSFNAITVDGDTSTSDTLLLFATGQAKHAKITDAADKRLKDFKRKLNQVLLDLAHQVVKDGEGATKFVAVTVTGAASNQAARRIGMSIANSPLVKTAIAGEDANWGRIVMAVGKAGEKADRDRLSINIGGIQVASNGQGVEGYDETPVTAHMKGQDIAIAVDIGLGKGQATVWTCDLTHAYIDINGSYRT